jgi:hypothetical protein
MGEFAGIRPLWLWLFLLIGIPALSFVLVDLASFFIILAVAFGFLGYRMAIGLNKPGWLGALAAVPIVNLAVFGYFAFFAE